MNLKTQFTVMALSSLALLGACSRNDEGRTVGQQVDSAVAKVDQKADEAKRAAADAADKVGDKAKDIAISAAIKADLARDDKLSALGIDVDTVDGHVTLRGTAPDARSRERAAALANAVSGVVAVDNQLVVEPRS